MEVPSEQHFYIIGRKGEHVKRVMSTTGCHVHFPDTHRNKSSSATAKNQVSIVGLAESAEHARRQVRSLLPLTIR